MQGKDFGIQLNKIKQSKQQKLFVDQNNVSFGDDSSSDSSNRSHNSYKTLSDED